jgi:hypothetical protein
MEGLAQNSAEVTLGIRGRLGEPESGRVNVPDGNQPQKATGPLVVDAAAGERVRDLGGHLRQPGKQNGRAARAENSVPSRMRVAHNVLA